MRDKERFQRVKLYINGSISAGFEPTRARQIVSGLRRTILKVPHEEAVRGIDSLGVFEKLGVEPASLLPKKCEGFKVRVSELRERIIYKRSLSKSKKASSSTRINST